MVKCLSQMLQTLDGVDCALCYRIRPSLVKKKKGYLG